jgi:hypothetical protein
MSSWAMEMTEQSSNQNNIDGRGTFTFALHEALATALSDEDLVRHQGLALVRN